MLNRIRTLYKKITAERSKLDVFLIKGALMAFLYFLLRILFRVVPGFHFLFFYSKKVLIYILVYTSNLILKLLGFSSQVHENIVYIEGSEGVRVINACLGWSVMALFAGFIIAYPGTKKSKYQIIPLGLVVLVIANILRISLMAIISYTAYDKLDFYHRYVFNFILYAVVISLWIFWIRKNSKKEQKEASLM
jgi:exosortase/archaeosortase family protein